MVRLPSFARIALLVLTHRAPEWLEDVGPFDVALVLLGINDAAKGLAGDFKTHYSSIVSLVAGLSFKPGVILGKPLPMLSREFVASTQAIAKLVDDVGRDQGGCSPICRFNILCHCPSGAAVIDLSAGKYGNELVSMLSDDGVHPNWAGDAAIAEGWFNALQQAFPARKTEM
jgi:lysophospholipase L1-like esterase